MKLSICFQTITEASAINSDYADHGFTSCEEEECESVDDVLSSIDRELSYLPFCEASASGEIVSSLWFTTLDADEDYCTGSQTFYSIHIDGASDIQMREIATALHCK